MNKDDYDIQTTHDQEFVAEGHYHFQQGLVFHMGEEHPKNYREALKLFIHAACQGYLHAQQMLVRYYSEGLGTPQDLHEAYIWALLVHTAGHQAELKDQADELEKRLTRAEVVSAQYEAQRRFQQLREKGVISLAEKNTPSQENRLPKTLASRKKSALPFAITDLRALQVTIYELDKNVTFALPDGASCTLPLREAFTQKLLLVLERYHEECVLNGVPILYEGNSLLHGSRYRRSNPEAVDDLNLHLRKLLHLASDVRAFAWHGKRRSERHLRALFKLEVVW